VYWVLSTSLAVWFLFIHSLPVLRDRFDGHAISIFYKDPAFGIHLVGAYTIYLACIHNTLLTPSCLNGDARVYHVLIGRIGMIAGLVGFVLGAYCAWSPFRPNHNQGFAIAITIGGVFQIWAQIMGYLSIRKYQKLKREVDELTSYVACEEDNSDNIKYGSMDENGFSVDGIESSTKIDGLILERDNALKIHIKYMVGLFVAACGIPAAIRIVGSISFLEAIGSSAIFISIGVLNCLAILFEKFYLKRME